MDRSCDTYEVFSGFWWGNITVTEHLEDLDVDERMILKWIFKNYTVRLRSFKTGIIKNVCVK